MNDLMSIDFNSDPTTEIPNEEESYDKGDQHPHLLRERLDLDPSRLQLWESERMPTRDLEKLLPENLLPVQVMSFLIEHPEHIPDAWRGKMIIFWTVVQSQNRQGMKVPMVYVMREGSGLRAPKGTWFASHMIDISLGDVEQISLDYAIAYYSTSAH